MTNWYKKAKSEEFVKTAKSFTDFQKWVLHGVDPQACRDEFQKIHAIRSEIQEKAKIEAEKLGHVLFKNWTVVNSNRCRKCGMIVSLPNINGQTSSPDYIGGAVTTECFVHLANTPKEIFDVSDEILDSDNPLNRHSDDTLI